MLKKTLIITTLILFSLGSVALSFASDEGPGGNKRKGKYTYRKLVKACFERGEIDSASPKVSPADKKQAQWKAVFEGKDFSDFGCKKEWDTAKDKDILDMYTYFYNFAADSPTPATCK